MPVEKSGDRDLRGRAQRECQRKSVSLVVEYDDADELCRDYTRNLSTGGVFIHTDRVFEIGDSVRLQLSFPGLLAALRISGIVRWVSAGEGEDDDNGAGIEFVDFDAATKASLELVLARVQEHDPEYVEPVLKVLLVEDNPHITKLIGEALERQLFSETAFQFCSEDNGAAGLTRLWEEPFDVLLIDINLPMMNGADVIAQLRASDKCKNLPVIAVSAGGKPAAQSALDAGADFFIPKPIRLRQIIETMKQLLRM